MKKLICKKTKGPLMEKEDWWYLCTEEDGTKTVIHEYCHTSNGGKKSNSGEKTYTIEDFLNGNHYQKAKDELNTMLNLLK